MGGLTLITPTGGRPDGFALLERFVSCQTYSGEIQWLVADDCVPQTPCTMGQTVVRPGPAWVLGQNTQRRNLSELLPLAQYDKVLFLEDEDYYSPSYFSVMSSRLDSGLLVGEIFSHYYNVAHRRYRIWGNRIHSSLGQVGVRAELLPLVTDICRPVQHGLIDIELCSRVTLRQLYPWSGIYVGIKGMPGRPGVTSAHRSTSGAGWESDPEMSVLRSWIGEDAGLYRSYFSYFNRQAPSMGSPQSQEKLNVCLG